MREAEGARGAEARASHLARRPPGRRRSTRAAGRPTQAPPVRSTGAAPARPALRRAPGTAEQPAQPALPTRARAEPRALRSWGCPRPALRPGRPSPDRRALPRGGLPAPPRTERPWAADLEGAGRRGRPNPRSGQMEPAPAERPLLQPRPTREGPVGSMTARRARPETSCPARADSTKGPTRAAPPTRGLVRTARPTRPPRVRARAPAPGAPRALPMTGRARQPVVTPAPASPRSERRPARTEPTEHPAHPSSGRRGARQAARRQLHPRPATATVARRLPATRARPTPTNREAGPPSSGPGEPAREAPTSPPRPRSGCLARPAGPEGPTSSCGGDGASSDRGLRRPALPQRGR